MVDLLLPLYIQYIYNVLRHVSVSKTLLLTFHPFSKHLHVAREVGDSLQEAGLGPLQARLTRLCQVLLPVVLQLRIMLRHQGLQFQKQQLE